MFKRGLVVFSLLLLAVAWANGDGVKGDGAKGGDDKAKWQLEQSLKEVIVRNFMATEAMDVDGIGKTLHSRSPVREGSLQVMKGLLARHRLRAELLEFRIVGVDGDYAVARGKQKITSVGTTQSSGSVTDCVYVFRREAGDWKLWQQCPLETKAVN